MDKIELKPMTPELAHRYYREFVLDPDLFWDKAEYREYVYDENEVQNRLDRYKKLGRIFMAVMLNDSPVGEVILKEIDYDQKSCTMGISLVNNNYKNKGYGTAAERLILNYAFEIMRMQTVYADALINNARSQHVLEKVGFLETHRDDKFIYYKCEKKSLAPRSNGST